MARSTSNCIHVQIVYSCGKEVYEESFFPVQQRLTSGNPMQQARPHLSGLMHGYQLQYTCLEMCCSKGFVDSDTGTDACHLLGLLLHRTVLFP